MRIRLVTRVLALLLVAWPIGCATDPELTGGSSSGTGGATTGTGGFGGGSACATVCPSCAPFSPWSKALNVSTNRTGLGKGQLVMPDGGLLVSTFATHPGTGNQLTRLDASGSVIFQIDGARVGSLLADDACGAFVIGTLAANETSALDPALTCPSDRVCKFVAKLDANGAVSWSRLLDHAPDQGISPEYMAASGGVLAVAGHFTGTFDFGDGPLETTDTTGAARFVAALSPSDGHTLWSRKIDGEGGSMRFGGLAVSAAGDVVISDAFSSTIDFGDGPVAATNFFTGLAAMFSATGDLRFAKLLGESAADVLPVINANGNIFVVGSKGTPGAFQVFVRTLDAQGNDVIDESVIDTGATAISAAVDDTQRIWVGVENALVVINGAGNPIAKLPLNGSGQRLPWSIGFGPGGVPIVAGTFDGTIDLGQGSLTALEGQSVFAGVRMP